MVKTVIIISLVAIVTSCNESNKGSWSFEDRKKAKEELNSSIRLKIYGNDQKKQEIIDCFLDKIELNYNNFEEAKNDDVGTDTSLRNCENKVSIGK